ncbi:Panacea domain-containing protein [Lactobacillus amylovorus]|uniref:Panacea domain-containing protein n=1 Tax=Lactobacillus amylovorus TaxID=1604 RepID=UPI003F90AC56
MYNVFQVVNWLRVRNNADLRTDPNAEELTQMKAMKLLYYIQAASLVVTGHRMFDNDIVAWKYGPVVEAVHKRYLHQRGIVGHIDDQSLNDYKELQNDQQTADILNSIYDIYGHSSAYDLMRQTHTEAPWKNTNQSDVISDEKIKDYFKDVFVINENNK